MTDTAYDDRELRRLIGNLAEEVAGLRQASTRPEKEEASKDVESAERALEIYAKANGISMEDAEDAINQIKRNQQKSALREVLKELLEEEGDSIFGDGSDSDNKADPKPKAKPKESKSDPEPPAPDASPGGSHWTDRRIGG